MDKTSRAERNDGMIDKTPCPERNDGPMERIAVLRARMKREGVDAVLVPTADTHGSEYIAEHFKIREYLSGFTGSAGSLFVTLSDAYLFTDSRYFIQAEAELSGSGIKLMKSGTEGIPLLSDFIKDTIKNCQVFSLDGRMVSSEFIEKIIKQDNSESQSGFEFRADFDPAEGVWTDRPDLQFSTPYFLDEKYTGESCKSKLERIRKKMKETGADSHLLTSLTDIAWICNMRADDVKHTPVFYSYMFIEYDKAYLFSGPENISENSPWDDIRVRLEEQGIILKPYFTAETEIRCLIRKNDRILTDKQKLNYYLTDLIQKNDAIVINKPDPSSLFKAIKNETELAGMRKAHIKDAVAVIKFLAELKNHGGGGFTELSAAERLLELRKEQDGFWDESFDPIMAYGEHGAIVHYSADRESNVEIGNDSILLFDTGAHYKNEGTTDITRTIAFSSCEEKACRRHYTLVLKAHLAILTAIFPKGVKGNTIDALAREILWKEGLDYGHGTGHGVGHLLSVHEGPQAFSTYKKGRKTNETAIEPGMITSDEPGLYFEGEYGIRIESLVECVDLGKEDKKYEGFYGFKPLTLVPFDRDLIDVSLLSDEEIKAINDYHKLVLKTLTPLLQGQALQFLQQACQELKLRNQDPQNN